MSVNRNKNLKYEHITFKEIEQLLKRFDNLFRNFLILKGFSKDIQNHISHYSLIDMIIRVDKRKAYYQCFHNMKINECKEVALYAYWVLKLRPFTITDVRYKTDEIAGTINESFAVFLLGYVLEAIKRIRKTPKCKEDYSRLMEYSFRFRNISIDSFIVLIESISTETLEREYPNLYDKP
jgi:hypothetical protein